MLISVAVHTIAELGFGLAAWGLALAALFLPKKGRRLPMLGMGSLACCAASLCMVVFELAHYADIVRISPRFWTRPTPFALPRGGCWR